MAKTKDIIPGGLADKTKKKFDREQLQKGKKVELEHTNDPNIALEIAKDHLTEDPVYYDKLEKIERHAETFWRCSKCAQEQDPELASPEVDIQPGRQEATCALEILKRWKPDYFVGVRRIIIGPSGQYGHVESGPDKDPTVINVNADRVIQESGGQDSGRAAALACAKVIAHEKGHVQSFDPQQGFVGGESPAEAEEGAFEAWLNSGGMQQIESLPCFQGMA